MKNTRGYTLVELIVSVAIFAVVMLSATAAYLGFINYNRRATQYGTLMSSLAFAVDAMARDIRTGTDYDCESGCSSGGTDSITFLDANGCEVTYEFTQATGLLEKHMELTAGGTNCANRDTVLIGASVTPGITLTSTVFYVRGEEPDDELQPLATVVLQGTTLIVDTGEEVPFNIQTTSTSRVPEAGNTP